MSFNERRLTWREYFDDARLLVRDDRGAVMAEYALVIGTVSVVSIVALLAFESVATTLFENNASSFTNSFTQSYGTGT